VRFVAVTDQPPRPSPDPATQPQTQRRTPPPRIQPEPTSANATSIPHQDSEQRDARVFTTERKPTELASRSIDQFDTHHKISAWIAGGGLLILGLSAFFKWIKIGAGGVTGLAGDGKILLAVTVLAAAAYSAAIVKRKWLTPVILSVQAWGTIAMFWMGALIWKVGSILDSPDVKDNPFAAMFSTMLVSPGAGLYLGLIGGITVAGALGFLAVRLLLPVRNLKPFYASQGISCVLGILLAFFVGPDHTSTDDNSAQKDAGASWVFPGAKEAADREKWKETHNVSDTKWDELVANFEARKHPESVSTTDWWEEAKDKTPTQLNKLYPPLQPHEWYRAEWVGGYSGSRELDRNINFGNKPDTYQLTLKVRVRTEPEMPIKELHGKMVFIKDKEIIYEAEVAEKPDVSFTDSCLVWLTIDPYDDNNEKQRTLRYAKDNELTPVFTVSKVVLADGTQKTFD
jgi:hypothetical protein